MYIVAFAKATSSMNFISVHLKVTVEVKITKCILRKIVLRMIHEEMKKKRKVHVSVSRCISRFMSKIHTISFKFI